MRSVITKPNPAVTVSVPVTVTVPPLSTLLPPSVDPCAAVISLITSRLSSAASPHLPPLDPTSAAERHLLPFVGPDQVSRILLLSLSHPLPSLSFLHWTSTPPLSLTPSPFHFSLLSLSLSLSRHFHHSLSLLSLFVTTHPDDDHLSSLLAASRFCSWDPAVLGLLIAALVREDHVKVAIRTCRRAIKIGFTPDVTTFNCLIARVSKIGNSEECWILYHDMKHIGVNPNTYTYNMLIDMLCKGKDVIKAKEFLTEIEDENGFLPDIVTYNTILNGYCRRRRLNAAFQLFDLMPLRGIEPNLISYTILIGGLCKDERIRDARKLFDRMCNHGVTPDSLIYKILIQGYCKVGRMKEVRVLVQQMVASGFELDGFTCELVLQSHVDAKKLLSCINFVALLRRQGVRFSLSSYTCLIRALCSEMKPFATMDLLKWMVDDNVQPDVKVYNTIIGGFCDCDRVGQAFGLKQEMEARGVIPDSNTWGAIISCLCRLNRTMEGEILMEEEIIKKGITPDADMCTMLVRGFCKEGNLVKAELILRRFVERFGVHDNRGFNALVRAYCEGKNVGRALELQDRMAELGFVGNKETCKSIIYGLSK